MAKRAPKRSAISEGDQTSRRGRPKKERPDGSNVTQGLIAEAVAEYMAHRSVIGRAAANCAASLKRFESQGVDPELVKETAKRMNLTQAEAAARHTGLTRYLVAAGAIKLADINWSEKAKQAGFEFAAAAGEASEAVREQKAKAEGYKSGRRGHSKESNPYKAHPGSMEFVGWLDGLQEGLDDRKKLRPETENVRDASDSRQRPEPPGAAKGAAPAAVH